MKTLKVFLGTVALSALGLGAAVAHDPNNPGNSGGLVGDDFYATAFLSGQGGRFSDFSGNTSWDAGIGIGGGITVGRGFEGVFGTDAAIRTEVEFSVGTGELQNFSSDFRYQTYFANAWWDLDCSICDGGLTPYLGGGLGYGQIRSDDAGLEGGGFSYQLGGGFNYPLDDNIHLGVGYRYLATEYEAPSIEDFDGHRVDGRIGLSF